VVAGTLALQALLTVMDVFTKATQISTAMALACTGPSNSELCWSSASPSRALCRLHIHDGSMLKIPVL
jgi:hypothetical protein